MTDLLSFPLRTRPDEDEREPDAAPEAAPELGPLVLLEGDRMTQRAQMFAALTHAFRLARRRARDLAEREGGLVHGLMAGQSPSVLDQHEYAKARNWVPPGHDGGTIEGMGVIYQWLVGRPGVAISNASGAIHARPFRWCVAAGLALIVANAALFATGHHLAAILTDSGAVLLTAAWAGAGHLLMRVTSAQPPPAPPVDHGTDI